MVKALVILPNKRFPIQPFRGVKILTHENNKTAFMEQLTTYVTGNGFRRHFRQKKFLSNLRVNWLWLPYIRQCDILSLFCHRLESPPLKELHTSLKIS